MCGISGIISKNKNPIQEPELSRINALIAHRGPDGEGYYLSDNVAFAHRRLAIIDLSVDGHQPMIRNDLVITFNGEIYNYIEVRDELMRLGHRFKSKSDTEVILASYEQWGPDCVQKFNGMWAFAIHDKKKEIVFCSRDRFGVKPFYYKDGPDFFYFGSEIKQFLNDSENRANPDLIAHFLFTGMHDHENRTFFEGIFKLPPSHNITIYLKDGRITTHKYFSLAIANQSNSYQEALENSIKLRLRSDVKVGTCLSGGLDSSTIAAIASRIYAKESNNSFTAIHAKSVEKATDESAFAQIVASHSNLELHITEPTAQDFKSVFEEVVYTQEEPFGSPSIYLQYFVMKKAAEIKCKVLLDGQGGDETLLGYERYIAPALATFIKEKGTLKTISEAYSCRKNNPKMGLKSIAKYLAGTFLPDVRSMYLKKKYPFFKSEMIPKDFSYWYKLKSQAFNIFKLQETELFVTNLQALLRYEDKNSMRHGIETRLPFIDYIAVQTALNLPIEEKIHDGWTKFTLRKICEKYLPSSIAWRKHKLGFNAPDHTWLSSIKPEAMDLIKGSRILDKFIDKNKIIDLPVSDWTTTWRLLNLAVWEKVYKVKV